MEPKKTTASRSSSSSMDKIADQKGSLDFEQQKLDENDCWFYQVNLERFVQISNPDPQQHSRYLVMIRMLAAQARRMAAIDAEEKRGHYRGLDHG